MTESKPWALYYLGLLVGTGSALAWTDGRPEGAFILWAVMEIGLVLLGWAAPWLIKRYGFPPKAAIGIAILLLASTVIKVALMVFFAAA